MRTAFRAEGEQFSERSDAGFSIVQELVRLRQELLSGAQRRRTGAAEKGAAALVPALNTGAGPGERQEQIGDPPQPTGSWTGSCTTRTASRCAPTPMRKERGS